MNKFQSIAILSTIFLLLSCASKEKLDSKKSSLTTGEQSHETKCGPKDTSCISKARFYYKNRCDKFKDLESCRKTADLITDYKNAWPQNWLLSHNDVHDVLEYRQIGCAAGDLNECKTIRRISIESCVAQKTTYAEDPSCYDVKTEVVGNKWVESVVGRLRTVSCDEKLNAAAADPECQNFGELEAKKKNYANAEKMFRGACNSKFQSGCDDLACVGYLKWINENKEAEARRIFTEVCKADNSIYARFCEIFPPRHLNKSDYSRFLNDAKEEAREKLDRCLEDWSNSWGS